MKDIAFILPYFGKFPNYFQLFLNSCKMNKNCDFLIFTDDYRKFNYPDNVIVKYMSFSELQDIFATKFDFKIALDKPYKLCDYKPSYGYVFEKYLKNYRYWGYCDCDLIWGDISKFFTPTLLDQYDKIGFLGHCTLFKNNKEINQLFMKKTNTINRYKEVLSNSENQIFDEGFNSSINNIFMNEHYNIMTEEFEANIYTKSSNLKITRYDFTQKKDIVESKKNSLFIYDNGHIYRYVKTANEIVKNEYLYIHLQARPMKVKIDSDINIYKIIPNAFENLEVDKITNFNFLKIKKKNFNLHYFKLRYKNFKIKIKRRLDKK